MRRRIRIAALVLPAVLISVACGAPDSGTDEADEADETANAETARSSTAPDRSLPPDRTLPPERRPTPVPSTSRTQAVTGEVPEGLLGEIVTDAAERFAVAVADVDVVRAEAVTWPDGSLGCPEPGIVYTQALVPGYWVVLAVDQQQLDYRVGRQGSFLLCENATTADPPGAGSVRTG